MHKTFLMPALLLAMPFVASAESLEMPAAEPTAAVSTALPTKGSLTTDVRKRFGEPTTQHSPVGGGSRQQPRITRWDYPGFSVFFENNHVVDAVIPGKPAEIHRREELQTP